MQPQPRPSICVTRCASRRSHARVVGAREAGGTAPPPLDFGRSVNPIQNKVEDYAHHITKVEFTVT